MQYYHTNKRLNVYKSFKIYRILLWNEAIYFIVSIVNEII